MTAIGDMSARYLDAQLGTLADMGFARDRALQIVGLDESRLAERRTRIGIDAVARLYDIAATELSNPLLGLEVGNGFRVAAFQKSGRIYAFCRDLVEVVETNARYQRVAIDAGVIRHVEEPQEDGSLRDYLEFAPRYADADAYRHITELVFGSYGTAFRWLSWGSGEGIASVQLRHAAPPGNLSLYDTVFGCPVAFGAPHNRLEFMPGISREPLATADPERLALMSERLEQLMRARGLADGPGASLSAALEAAIRTCLRNGAVSLPCAADVLERSERALRADLKREGLRFRDALDAVRRKRFHEMRDMGASLAETAQALAYNDQAAFNRAFRRWYGVAPGRYDPALHGSDDGRES